MDYTISTDKSRLDVGVIKGFLERSYWGKHRAEETIIRTSIDNSLCYGVYDGGRQIGFARVITDFATSYYLCDVYIDEDYRGKGVGKSLIEAITTSDELKNVQGILGTKDAHGLYEQYGFARDAERFMRRVPDYLRERIANGQG
ncbi:GNAT family N-acetyltransferase [Paenibacillus sp. HJGM_3]|uniref:GNAT family N-acetyltransferase n=1 Tax=Paenibacillus sp. HJGM_3 TaxID=3379816 RepID=UPI00385CA7E6